MNKIKRTTVLDRIRNAVRAFKGERISTLYLGMDVKQCDQCEYKSERPLRDNLLVTAGARAAYMEDANCIEFPHGVNGEAELAESISRMVDRYLQQECCRDINYDEYIELALKAIYRVKED